MARPVPADRKGVTITDAEIAMWAKQNGFPDSEIATAVAVALAESRGRIDAIGDGGKSYGLWQIHEPSHPDLFKLGDGQWWSSYNAMMAYQVWSRAGRSWRPWSVYNSGAYLLFMDRGRKAADNPAVPDGQADYREVLDLPGGLNEIANAVKEVASGIFKAGAWIGKRENIIRAAQVALGGAMLIGATVIVVKPVIGQAASVVPVGKVARALK